MATVPIAAQVAAVAREQDGLITAADLSALGIKTRRIESWRTNGRLERVMPGVFRLGGAPSSRHQRLSTAVLWGGTDALASHRSAGDLWGFDGMNPAKPEITVPISTHKRSSLVVVHQTRMPLTERRARSGIPTTTPERTIIDLAGSLRSEQMEIAFESARRERVLTIESVTRALAAAAPRGRDGTAALQTLLTDIGGEPPCESALEVITARLLRTSDLPKPKRQVEVRAFGRTYRLDFAWPHARMALECDGKRWHEAAFERDRRRWSAIGAATGYRIVWATWMRVKQEPDQLVAELRDALTGA